MTGQQIIELLRRGGEFGTLPERVAVAVDWLQDRGLWEPERLPPEEVRWLKDCIQACMGASWRSSPRRAKSARAWAAARQLVEGHARFLEGHAANGVIGWLLARYFAACVVCRSTGWNYRWLKKGVGGFAQSCEACDGLGWKCGDGTAG